MKSYKQLEKENEFLIKIIKETAISLWTMSYRHNADPEINFAAFLLDDSLRVKDKLHEDN
jgi:hypothetical protein